MRYRPHIDGLRAVAIVPVVLFHPGLEIFPGGFTGVDVFFVISGFLITSLIVEEIAEGRFAIWNFYKRRALRILPAYLVMIAVVAVASWFTFFPDETRALGGSIAAASLFVSNIYFWNTSDYFAAGAEFAPMLHTWTLSVEEQYYLLLPVGLLLVARFFGRRYATAIVAVSVVSFALSVWALMTYRETAAFYLLPPRAWEFGLGSLAAVTGLVARGSPRLRAAGATAGAALVAWGFLGLDEDSVFPGPNAIFPALGAMLLISCSEGNLAGRILGSRPFVALGRISYSLYLWHWPIIIFWRIEVGPALRGWDIAAILALSLVAAMASYRFVEQPFRRPAMRARPALRINGAALASMALAAAVGGGLVLGAGRWGSYPPELARIAGYIFYPDKSHPCFVGSGTPGRWMSYDPAVCLAPDPLRPTLLVMGDSHAEHLVPEIGEGRPEFNLQFAGATGCTPTVDVEGDWWCPRIVRPVLWEHVPGGGVDVVVLSARWKPEHTVPLRETVDYLLDHVDEVVILGPTPEYLDDFPLLLARGLRRGREDPERFLDPEVRALDRRWAATDWGGGRYISLYDLICPDRCRHLTREGVPYMTDYGHYTDEAAREIVADLDDLAYLAESYLAGDVPAATTKN